MNETRFYNTSTLKYIKTGEKKHMSAHYITLYESVYTESITFQPPKIPCVLHFTPHIKL
jgi:hypothetical protein